MSQKKIQEKRQTFAKQIRRQQRQQIISSKRKSHSIDWAQKQKQTFISLLPTINEHNYEQNRFLLSSYARSNTYSYEMLSVAFVAYQYLLVHPLDDASWEILTYLSSYEDFEIPQTLEFTQILVKYFDRNPELISEMLLNISKLPKFSLLHCRLIDAEIIYSLEKNIHSVQNLYIQSCLQNKSKQFKGKDSMELQIHNFLFTLCELFTIQPTLQNHHMNKICEIFNLQNSVNKFVRDIHTEAIIKLIQNATQKLSHQPSIIQLLVQKFQTKISSFFFLYEEQSINFINCCVKNKLLLTERLIKNLFLSIKSNNVKNKVSSLKMLQKILNCTHEIEKMEVQPNKFQTLQPLIENKISISFEDFNSMFTSNKHEPVNSLSQPQLQNRSIVCSLIFTENYQVELKNLFQIFQSSNSQIQQEIAVFILDMVACLIEEINNFETQINSHFNIKKSSHQNMIQFLNQTVSIDETYYFLIECLKSSNISLIQSGLSIIKELVLYFCLVGQNINGENQEEMDFFFVLNKLDMHEIFSLVHHLIASETRTIGDLAENIFSIIEEESD